MERWFKSRPDGGAAIREKCLTPGFKRTAFNSYVNGPHNKLPTPHHQIRPRMWAICGLLGDRDFCLLEVRRLARKKRDYVQAANLAIDLKLVDEMEELIVPLLLEEHPNMLEAFMAKSKGIQIKVMACLFYCVY